MRRVVVTGMGIVSSIGNNTQEVLASLREAKSGITRAEQFADHGFRCQVAGVPNIDVESMIDRRAMRFLGQGAAWNHIAMEKAIRDSDLGVNPTNDGQILRVVFPQLTEERRRDLVKQARAKGEDAKVAIRNIRRRAKDELDRIAKDGEAGEDDVRRAEKELDNLTEQHVHHVDEAMKNKETELLEV